ncbi:hypothetical protein [Arthrobacter bambusae]|uniref:Uracil-DNA glycosylase-like domain-containing protein n=1 Tax=Arthrobacter bambusae TaxID=1338426 RepID=A0AAW8DG25_9MICC|nr:hypothetical protein [Arthrobacter bambusae]MDP9905584.1 hypothetical protein [Arthrobacter bambusae]MDQ0127334.1 hypothetical protein [Arthrobacter bambusae]MDQ0178676.1 hypothetical protein [Arthrobacter bambusae]
MTSLLETMARYEMTASWAVWPPSASYERTSDISFPAGVLDGVLHARSVILGLNPGESSIERRPWQNFHTAGKHNDHFLAEAFRDTPHWGAYMTDLLTEVNSKSATVDLSGETIGRDVAVLVEQLQSLGAADPLFIVIGTKAAKAFIEHEPVLADAVGLSRPRWVVVPHYSAANGRIHGNSPEKYRRLVLEAVNDTH